MFNPLRAKFFRGNINIYLHFVSFLYIDMTQVVEILPQITQEPTYSYKVNIMAADVLATPGSQGISSHDIDLVKPSSLGPRTLRVNI